MNITIDKELFQWEKDREVFIKPSADDPYITFIQFYNKNAKFAKDCLLNNGKVKIPNELLKEDLPIMVVVCSGSRGETNVIGRREFRVLSRKKPQSYIDDEEIIYKEIVYDGGVEYQ